MVACWSQARASLESDVLIFVSTSLLLGAMVFAHVGLDYDQYTTASARPQESKNYLVHVHKFTRFEKVQWIKEPLPSHDFHDLLGEDQIRTVSVHGGGNKPPGVGSPNPYPRVRSADPAFGSGDSFVQSCSSTFVSKHLVSAKHVIGTISSSFRTRDRQDMRLLVVARLDCFLASDDCARDTMSRVKDSGRRYHVAYAVQMLCLRRERAIPPLTL